MEKSFGLFFFIKKSKSSKAVEHFIYLHITIDGVGCDISTKRKCDPAKWNGDAGRAEGKTESVRSLNSYLDLLQRKVYEARQQLLHHGHPVTAENVKTVFYGKEIQTHRYMLMEVFKKHNELDQIEWILGRIEGASDTFCQCALNSPSAICTCHLHKTMRSIKNRTFGG